MKLIHIAKQVAQKTKCQRGAIVIRINKETYELASYGNTKKECAELGKMVDWMAEKIEDYLIDEREMMLK